VRAGRRKCVFRCLERIYREKVRLDPLGDESRFRIGEIKDLDERVNTAINNGAVAYVPS